MQRTKWIERKFTFDYPEGWMPVLIERLRGTTARMEALTRNLSDEIAGLKEEGKWSVKEHIGHLTDLEELHSGRIDELIQRKPQLRPADMTNAKTNQANHNSKTIQELISAFEIPRTDFLRKLESLDDETQMFQSLHPRLQKPMRPVDVAYFAAEHDDHHLASIRELL